MLQTVEVVSDLRRSLRRRVHVECQVLSDLWREPVPLLMTELSEHGAWLEAAFPLTPGEDVTIAFAPPKRSVRTVLAGGTVRRVELRRRLRDPRRAGMGIELDRLTDPDRDVLREALLGLPPPLPRIAQPSRVRREQIWVDALLTWEEDLGDRVNVFEVSEQVGYVDEDELEPRALARPLH